MCCSGIVYCIIHDVPLYSRDGAFFNRQNRSQTGIEGWVISGLITGIGVLLVLVGVVGDKCRASYSTIISLVALAIVWIGVQYLENVFRSKGWYNPSF